MFVNRQCVCLCSCLIEKTKHVIGLKQLLPEAVFEQAGITAQWVGINRLGAHTYKKPSQKGIYYTLLNVKYDYFSVSTFQFLCV